MVQLEAGMTLSQLLAAAIPRGWFLPVTPGTQFVTIGGALANDVHGKNHHLRGTFGCHVMRFELIRHGEPPMVCSAVENPLFFAASIGGLGLTGVISRVELQLMPIRTSQINSTVVRFANLAEFLPCRTSWTRSTNTAWPGLIAWREAVIVAVACTSSATTLVTGR